MSKNTLGGTELSSSIFFVLFSRTCSHRNRQFVPAHVELHFVVSCIVRRRSKRILFNQSQLSTSNHECTLPLRDPAFVSAKLFCVLVMHQHVVRRPSPEIIRMIGAGCLILMESVCILLFLLFLSIFRSLIFCIAAMPYVCIGCVLLRCSRMFLSVSPFLLKADKI